MIGKLLLLGFAVVGLYLLIVAYATEVQYLRVW